MTKNPFNIQGLSNTQVIESRKKFGPNKLQFKKENTLSDVLLRILKEPMTLLLLAASAIYFMGGEHSNAVFMICATLFIAFISLYQDTRSKHALQKLKDLSQPNCKVIRSGRVEEIKSEDLVIGDYMLAEEGSSITADGRIIQSHDFSVNESILTGESMAVFKHKNKEDQFVYNGTIVVSGQAIAEITAIGNDTQLGKIGKSLESIEEEKTPLEIQITGFVKWMAISGAVVFVIVWVINYLHSKDFLNSLLQSLTLAMSILPEEIPVAFTTFMALGAWRLMKLGIVVKQTKTVETLGSATVICTDKTGTITENQMSMAAIFVLKTGQIVQPPEFNTEDAKELLADAMWASEPAPFDPMEVAIHQAYSDTTSTDERNEYTLVHEYPLDGKPPIMTHVFSDRKGRKIIAAKGAPEGLIRLCSLNQKTTEMVQTALATLTGEGYRVLAVGVSDFSGNAYPQKQQDLPFELKGLVAFYDPPKKNIQSVLEDFYTAGIQVKIITGDNAATTTSIAKQIGFRGYDQSISGDELMKLTDEELENCVIRTQIFTRMFPEAKLRIIHALKSQGQIVAMTGDGVNDGPALKASHIGIAMGRKGTEIAKQAASLILLEDDLSKLTDAVAMGRKIYTNLKKAIQYIISIHIPIILTVFVPLALGWVYPNIFSPVHIIFLELIMGPTCSIVFENEPMEPNTMSLKPKPLTTTFFHFRELLISIIQGLTIAAGTLFVYHYSVTEYKNEAVTRAMIFTVLIAANIFLTLVNRSFYYSMLTTLKYKNNMVILVIALSSALLGLILWLEPLTSFFEFERLNSFQFLLSLAVGFLSVIWFEGVKYLNRKKQCSSDSQ